MGPAGLETIFHEAGHSLVQKVVQEIGAEENRRGRKLSNQNLWHGIMFYTTGELVQRQLPTFVPYAIKYGMWEKNGQIRGRSWTRTGSRSWTVRENLRMRLIG